MSLMAAKALPWVANQRARSSRVVVEQGHERVDRESIEGIDIPREQEIVVLDPRRPDPRHGG
jgi:hypothetical protein